MYGTCRDVHPTRISCNLNEHNFRKCFYNTYCAANKTRRVLKKVTVFNKGESTRINILCKEIKRLKHDVSHCFLFARLLLCEHTKEFWCCAYAHAYLALGERINPLGPLQETRKKKSEWLRIKEVVWDKENERMWQETL